MSRESDWKKEVNNPQVLVLLENDCEDDGDNDDDDTY